jgi:PiT family inorganic phosphate transporter
MTAAAAQAHEGEQTSKPDGKSGGGIDLDKKMHPAILVFLAAVAAAGLAYFGYGVLHQLHSVREPLALGVFGLMGLALAIAFAFEFVNGFHDTANAVATVIYTHALPPVFAVIWSGIWNFVGVVVSTGAVAFTIVRLLPVDLVLHTGSPASYAMLFALLIAAILWNLATWFAGIPNSSTHCLIGSILGVGLANQLMSPKGQVASGADWGGAIKVLEELFVSPLVGFAGAALMVLILKQFLKEKALWEEPETGKPPPTGIRGLLILTCTAVSFAHGGNDGQKSLGLIMLILVGTAPTAFAVNRSMTEAQTGRFLKVTAAAEQVLVRPASGVAGPPGALTVDQARKTLRDALCQHKVDQPPVKTAIAVLGADVARRAAAFGGVKQTPAAATPNMHNDMYMVGAALESLGKNKTSMEQTYGKPGAEQLKTWQKAMDGGVRFIPVWVKVVVAIALGLGTMVGWKRIVKTVGERIGGQNLTYGQGASAEIVAAATILFSETMGAPVSTTHILSSGVAGTMTANGSGLQWNTVRNLASAWVVTLPVAMTVSGLLYCLFLHLIGARPI